MVTIEEKEFRSIINSYKMIDSWFWIKYSLNPYQGCEFSCTYCDARSHKYHIHPEFDQKIIIKQNAAAMLDKRISRSRTLLPDVVGMAGVCDPYQPVEKELEQTRSILRVIEKHRWPVHIITKSPLVLRDIELIEPIARHTWATVSFTITTLDLELAAFLEPKAPPPQERLNTLRTMKKQHPSIQTGILMMPIVPFLEDDPNAIETVVREAKHAGAEYILFSPGMTMRDDQALWFMKELGRRYPELVPKYEELYGFTNTKGKYAGSYSPQKSYGDGVATAILSILEKYEMPFRMKRFIPNDFRRLNYIIAEKLLNTSFDLKIAGKQWKKQFWVGHNIENLKESVEDIERRGGLGEIRGMNEEIRSFILRELNGRSGDVSGSFEAMNDHSRNNQMRLDEY